jgi:hypothetical protein
LDFQAQWCQVSTMLLGFRVSSTVQQTMLVTVVPSRYINTEKAKIKLSLGLMSNTL